MKTKLWCAERLGWFVISLGEITDGLLTLATLTLWKPSLGYQAARWYSRFRYRIARQAKEG